MAGFQQLRVTRKVDFTGATLLGVGGMPYLAGGNVFFVDYLRGDDGYAGTNPNYAKKTIASAFLSTEGTDTSIQNDYIFVLASKDQDAAATIAPPALRTHWHLIGISNPQATFGVVLRVTGETISCMSLGGSSFCAEIAGISFGGGATEKGGIYLEQNGGLWIHNCIFGHSFCGDTPYFGIHGGANNQENCLVEDCFFYGNGNNSQGKITTDGIYLQDVGAAAKNFIIRNNVFLGIPGVALNVTMLGGMILNNRFALDDDTAGAGITLGTHSVGCYIDGNHLTFGETGTTTNGYTDNAGAHANSWGLNYIGKQVAMPA